MRSHPRINTRKGGGWWRPFHCLPDSLLEPELAMLNTSLLSLRFRSSEKHNRALSSGGPVSWFLEKLLGAKKAPLLRILLQSEGGLVHCHPRDCSGSLPIQVFHFFWESNTFPFSPEVSHLPFSFKTFNFSSSKRYYHFKICAKI